MSHSRHYLDLNPAPGESLQRIGVRAAWSQLSEADKGAITALGIMVVATLFGLLLMGLLAYDKRGAPVLPPATVHQAVDEARIEGFRAGYATATEQGCTQPQLHSPLPAR